MSYQYFLTFPDIPGYSRQKLNHVMLKDDERAEVKGHQVLCQSFGAGNKLTGDIGLGLRSSRRNTGKPLGDEAVLGD